jgi:hypothetical protein
MNNFNLERGIVGVEATLLRVRAPGEDKGGKGTPRGPVPPAGTAGGFSLSPPQISPRTLRVGWLEVVSMSIIAIYNSRLTALDVKFSCVEISASSVEERKTKGVLNTDMYTYTNII